jgi:YbbR domain-containing protein
VHPQIILDLSSATSGGHTYAIAGAVKVPHGVRMVSALPAQVHYTFEPHASRSIPVEVRFSGLGHNGYEIASQTVTPPTLDVEGPASHVAAAGEVVTDPVDLSEAFGTKTYRVTAFVADPFVRIKSASPQVAVTVTMKKK